MQYRNDDDRMKRILAAQKARETKQRERDAEAARLEAEKLEEARQRAIAITTSSPSSSAISTPKVESNTFASWRKTSDGWEQVRMF